MSGTILDTIKDFGLSDRQVRTLAALQEQGRGLDFVYHFTDDGRDPRSRGHQFDVFRDGLRVLANEGEGPRQFAAAVWEHVTPRFVGWRPDYAEGVETRHLTGLLIRLDQEIDSRLGRDIPQQIRAVSQEVRARFDDLAFQYEAGSWHPSRGAGEIRDEMLFVASLDEKIRGVLYGNARSIDLRHKIEHVAAGSWSSPDGFSSEAALEAKGYKTHLAHVSDMLTQLRGVGVEVRTGIIVRNESESLSQFGNAIDRNAVRSREAREMSPKLRQRPLPSSHLAIDASEYWRNVAGQTTSAAFSPAQSLIPAARRGRPV